MLDFLLQPYIDLPCVDKGEDFCGFDAANDPALFFFDPVEGMTTRLRIASYGGLILAMPVILWQMWRFIVPALHAKENATPSRSSCRRSCCSCWAGSSAYVTLGKALEFLDRVGRQRHVGARFQVSKSCAS